MYDSLTVTHLDLHGMHTPENCPLRKRDELTQLISNVESTIDGNKAREDYGLFSCANIFIGSKNGNKIKQEKGEVLQDRSSERAMLYLFRTTGTNASLSLKYALDVYLDIYAQTNTRA